MPTRTWALAFANDWCDAWNRRDLDAVMAHYADEVELNSPLVVRRWGIESGWLRGKDRLRENFARGMQTPGLHFTFVNVLLGAQSLCVIYQRETGALVTDLIELDASDLAVRVVACHENGVPAPQQQPTLAASEGTSVGRE
ncbi:nuclear transport factor 2 family protein [Variovorax sp. ZS18.2.2]|uniref:YybH family protein n=1 Tax=Variovorax sp. ZS18.2.2 TaxID=2971255 RepID=UPI00215175D4|nr:nuclear transport factor 2 family protein [Variovorax sp. ZS18.2.2]MCR6480886.1 nuclear transport factor 2 family protein [Variovorax sp. ZS18.2.2]